MHDPHTLAFDIKYPWKNEHGYRDSFISIWHCDPCKDGSDDSCGWFKRARHGNQDVLRRIEKAFEFDWDSTFTSEGSGKTYDTGLFYKSGGMPRFSVIAVVLNLFLLAAKEYYKDRCGDDMTKMWSLANKFMCKNLYDIIIFAENPTDSLHDSLVQKWGDDDDRKARIHNMAGIIYGWILRADLKWYQHPRWHIHHWELQIHPWQKFKRWITGEAKRDRTQCACNK